MTNCKVEVKVEIKMSEGFCEKPLCDISFESKKNNGHAEFISASAVCVGGSV